MLTFSVNEVTAVQMLRVQKTIQENLQYFKKFNGARWEEAVNKAFMVAVQHAKADYESLDPYIKNLARNILKEPEKERPYDTITEDGEVSYPFLTLTTVMDDHVFVDQREILETFKELYLLHELEFMKLKAMFLNDSYKFAKNEVVHEETIINGISALRLKYGATEVFNLLYDFFAKLPTYTMSIPNATTKEIELKVRDVELLSEIPDIPLIRDETGRYYGIDKLNLTMERDPDTFNWDVITSTSCDIIKIDMGPLLNYMYEQVFVPKGVQTRHIFWCDDMYRLMTPAGEYVVDMDKNKFINLVRLELVENLIVNRFNTIIAISPDYIYLKPTRSLGYDTVRLVLATGRVVDLPIEVHIKKRK